MELRRYLDPRTPWKESTELDKVRLYTSQSLIGVVVAIAIASVTESATTERWFAIAATLVCSAAAILAILGLPGLGGAPRGNSPIVFGAMIVAGVAAAVTGSPMTMLWTLVIVCVPITAVLALRWSFLAGVILGVGVALFGGSVLASVATFLVTAFMALTVRLSMWLLRTVSELDAARNAAAQLSVAEERLRFSRDLHDVVGRALSAIAVKSELAATLSRRGDERAADQMDEVRDLAQQSMTEARQLARGYRSVDLLAEIDGARSLLAAAGIETETDGGAGTIDPAHAEAAAWVVREGATNVLRHSDATRCRIVLNQNTVSVVNDRPHAPRGSDGTGIEGLRERLAAVGGTVDVTCTADEFTLAATFPSTVAS